MLELLEGSTFRCGESPSGAYMRHAWVLKNVGTEPLRIRTRFTSGRSGFSLWQGEEHVIEPGLSVTVHLTWATPLRANAAFTNHATLRTNDPHRAEFRLRIVGKSDAVTP